MSDKTDAPPRAIKDLPTLAECRVKPCAPPKGVPRQIAKERKQKSKDDQGKAFRDEVWARDQGRCRATGATLVRSGTVDDQKLGEVDHSIPRSLAPERLYDTSNGLLLQKRLNRLRKAACIHAPEHKYFDYTGPDNRALPQHFVWRDDEGKVVKERIG
jgi:5-methylcytosine-specific restriction endonuclease McrA